MTSKQRFLAALNGELPDRLPVTTHHLMPSFLKQYMNGISNDEFFDYFGLDPILWVNAHKPDERRGQYFDPAHFPGYLEPRRINSDTWRIIPEIVESPDYRIIRYKFITPEKTLTMLIQSDEHMTWVKERLIKEKSDIDIIERYATRPICDVDGVNREAERYGSRGMIRGAVSSFERLRPAGLLAGCLRSIRD